MSKNFRSLLSWGANSDPDREFKPTVTTLFPKVDPAVDGEDCDHDCATCTVFYPKAFKTEESMDLYGGVKPWETHLLVATGKMDWSREVSDEKGSVMETIGSNVKGMKLSASNMPLPRDSNGYGDPTNVLLLPAMTVIENVLPANVPILIRDHVELSIKTTTRLSRSRTGAIDEVESGNQKVGEDRLAEDVGEMNIPRESCSIQGAVSSEPRAEESLDALEPSGPQALALKTRACPHDAVILLCSQRSRDIRCGQSAPLLRREFERHLRPLGLYRDLDDDRLGGVGIYFISHVGGHKWSANVLIYRRTDPWGVEGEGWGEGRIGEIVKKAVMEAGIGTEKAGRKEGASQCIWLARVKPEDCEGIVKYTVLQGKVVKPERQLRGGFDREKGLVSW